MTSEQLSALQQYVNTVKDLMGLKDWTIEVRDKALDDPDIIAQVKHTEGRKFARVYVGEKWREQDAEGKRAAIVHELVHCQYASATDVIRLDLYQCSSLSQQTYDMVWGAYKRQVEYATDAIADVIAPYMPLPEQANDGN